MSKNKPKDKKAGGADPSQAYHPFINQDYKQWWKSKKDRSLNLISLSRNCKIAYRECKQCIEFRTEENYEVTTTRDDMQKKYEDKNDQQVPITNLSLENCHIIT